VITINGTDLATLGFRARDRTLPGLGGERTVTLDIPGGIPVRAGGIVQPDRLIVRGDLTGSSHADVLGKRDGIAAALRGECVIRFSDITDREWLGRLQQGASRFDVADPAWAQKGGPLALDFLLPDPRARAQTETTVAGLSPALALGTAPTPLRVTITNGATAAITRVVIQVQAGATVLRELQWDGSVALSKVLVIDGETFAVTNDGANAIDGLTPASEFPVADPDKAADSVAITVTGGGGHSASTVYRKRWW
jgi:hypothetical protein